MAHAGLRDARPAGVLALATVALFGVTAHAAPKDPPKPAPTGGDAADVVKTIDEAMRASWKDNSITPSPRCDDHEFIRRATLDIIGRIATPKEIREYMDDPAKERRQKLIERLLKSEDYAKNWANLWANWLLTRSGAFGRGQYHEETQTWLEDQFAQNKPFRETVRALITAEGKNTDNGAVNFILAHLGENTPANEVRENGQFNMVPITSRITRLFLGVQTQCAQCHDHPADPKLKQNHFWGINAYLRQVRRDGTPPMPGNRMMGFTPLTLRDDASVNQDAQVFFETRNAKLLPAKAQFIDGTRITSTPKGEKKLPLEGKARREELAQLILEHPNFGMAQVNRMWAHFFSKGFVNPIDDFNSQNTPSHAELLEKLGERYKHYGCDQKMLIRWICNSEAYSLSSVANKTNDKADSDQPWLFARMLPKAMSPEELFESLMVATGGSQSKEQKKELRTRWLDNLISNFGDDEGNEVSFNGTVVQALMMMNGNDLNGAIAPSGKDEGNVAKIYKRHGGNARGIVQELYLLTLNRPPTVKELEKLSAGLRMRIPDKDVLAPYQDLLWAILNSNEFMLNH
jgi:hypothetical protein